MPGEFNHLPDMAAKLPEIISKLIRKTCFDLQAVAQTLAPVKTGFLKSSIYVMTHDASTYGQDLQGDGTLEPPIETPPENEGWVVVGASYGAYVELGTSKMAAQPYMAPAAEVVGPSLEKAVQVVNDELAKVV